MLLKHGFAEHQVLFHLDDSQCLPNSPIWSICSTPLLKHFRLKSEAALCRALRCEDLEHAGHVCRHEDSAGAATGERSRLLPCICMEHFPICLACMQACTSLQELRLGDAAGFCHADMRVCPVIRPADAAAFRAHMPFLRTLDLGSSQVELSHASQYVCYTVCWAAKEPDESGLHPLNSCARQQSGAASQHRPKPVADLVSPQIFLLGSIRIWLSLASCRSNTCRLPGVCQVWLRLHAVAERRHCAGAGAGTCNRAPGGGHSDRHRGCHNRHHHQLAGAAREAALRAIALLARGARRAGSYPSWLWSPCKC